MRRVLLDADAFLCLRKLGWLVSVCGSSAHYSPLLVTEYVARKELSTVDGDVRALESSGRLEIVRVKYTKHDPAGKTYLSLRQDKIDRGEAEAIAWALTLPSRERPVFVTGEIAAARIARERHVPCADIFGFVVATVVAGWLPKGAACSALQVWDDRRHELGRPRDWTSFDATFAMRVTDVEATFELVSVA